MQLLTANPVLNWLVDLPHSLEVYFTKEIPELGQVVDMPLSPDTSFVFFFMECSQIEMSDAH